MFFWSSRECGILGWARDGSLALVRVGYQQFDYWRVRGIGKLHILRDKIAPSNPNGGE